MKRISQVAFTALVFMCQLVTAQTPRISEPILQPVSTGLALEVSYLKGRPPAYSSVVGPNVNPSGAWYTLFDRIQPGEASSQSLPVQAVDVRSRLEGKFVRVTVSVFLGVRFHEKKEQVGVYDLRENERVSTDALTNFGVQPFIIKVFRVHPNIANTPSVSINLQSLAFVGLEPLNTTLPSFKLTFQNTSNKNVMAMSVNILANSRLRGSSLPQGENGRPLIPVGALGEIKVSGFNNAQNTPHGYQPEPIPDLEIAVTSAVFEDGSFEGDPKTAARFIAFATGRRIQLARIIELIDSNANSPQVDFASALEVLKAQASLLGTDALPAELRSLRDAFPQLTVAERENLKTSVDAALQGVKTDFLQSIQDFEKNNAQASEPQYRTWLKTLRLEYQHWLARLGNETRSL